MVDLRFELDWASAGSGDPAVRATAARLGIYVGDTSLTRSEDIWSKTVSDRVLVSAYPLAMWLASSWWRLNFEPVSSSRTRPAHDWRMAHELGAANHGYVWPSVVMAADGEFMQVWAAPSQSPEQSLQYLQGLVRPQFIALGRFQQSVDVFIRTILNRLNATDLGGSDLAQLWSFVQEDLANREVFRRRKLEAELGFDPEECPEEVLEAALQWEGTVGDTALTELAPAIAQAGGAPDLDTIGRLAEMRGLIGRPLLQPGDIHQARDGLPWERAVSAARALRQMINNRREPLRDRNLYDLLGLTTDQISNWQVPSARSQLAVAMPVDSNQLEYVPRKRNPQAKRFELARFLGEHLNRDTNQGGCFVSGTV